MVYAVGVRQGAALGLYVLIRVGFLEADVKQFLLDQGAKPGDLLPLLRVALAGTMKGPAIFDMASALGQTETVRRLRAALVVFNG